MTIHIDIPDYHCLKCKAIFIPYKNGIKCPKCATVVTGTKTGEYSHIIYHITSSMEFHKGMYGAYTPGAWIAGNFVDRVKLTIYQIFDQLENEKPKDEEGFLMDLIEGNNWGNQEYLKKHVKEIAIEVLVVYRAEGFSLLPRGESDKETREPKKVRLRRWLKSFFHSK